MTPFDTSNGGAAVAYAREFGWSVIPTHPTTKKPVIPWARYQQEIADEATIRAWFAKYQAAGVAVITGAVSGLWVVDIDSAAGRDRLAPLHLPVTPSVTSGKGAHLYFARPDLGASGLRNTAGQVDGLDTRGDGGFVVAPPSVHPSGRRYTWRVSPWDTAPAPAPGALIALFATRGDTENAQPVGVSGDAYARLLAEGAPAGRRHDDMIRLVGHLLAHGLNDAEISVLLRPWVDRCAPPFAYAELDETIRTLRAADTRNHGSRWSDRPGSAEAGAIPRGGERLDGGLSLSEGGSCDPQVCDPPAPRYVGAWRRRIASAPADTGRGASS